MPTFSLLTSDGKPCTGQSLLISPLGLDLQLQCGAGQELIASTMLTLKPDQNSVREAPQHAVSSTNLGNFPQSEKVTWLIADWGIDRPLNLLEISLTKPNPDTTASYKARVKIFTNGYWLPLTPIDILALNSQQVFAPVMASKVMVELVSAGDYGLWKPESAVVNTFKYEVSTAPVDTELTIAGQNVSFKQIGLLPSIGFTVEGFAQAINHYLQQNPDATTVPLHLSAKNAGRLNIDFQPVTQNVLEQFPEHQDGKLNLYWQAGESAQATAQTSITLSENAQLQELGFVFDYTPSHEQLCFHSPIAAHNKAQLANQRAQIAQGFQTAATGISLMGFDIKLDKRSEPLTATLALHPDQHGYPAANPYGGAVLTIDESSHWQNGWLNLTFPNPIGLPDANWWLVLTVQQGDAFWWFADTPPEPARATYYRIDQSAWLTCLEQQWLQTRVRLLNLDIVDLTGVEIQRSTAKVSLTQQKNFLSATPEALAILNKETTALVTLEATAPATGLLTLSKLRLTYR